MPPWLADPGTVDRAVVEARRAVGRDRDRAAVRPRDTAADPVLDRAHAGQRVPRAERHDDRGDAPAAEPGAGWELAFVDGAVASSVNAPFTATPALPQASRARSDHVYAPSRTGCSRGVAQVPGESRQVAGQRLRPNDRAGAVADLDGGRHGLREPRRDHEAVADAVGVGGEERARAVQRPRDGGARISRREPLRPDVSRVRRPEAVSRRTSACRRLRARPHA